MSEILQSLLIICPLVFLSGFVDAIVGGGGIISLPAYLIAGLPTHFAVGTNKTVAGLGTCVSVWRYLRGGKVRLDIAVPGAVGSLVGAGGGTRLALALPEQALHTLLLVALPCVAVFLVFNRGFGLETSGEKPLAPRAVKLRSLLVGLAVGAYDGLIGPGAGTFLIIGFTAALGTDLLTSSACGRVANLASNLTSMVIYMAEGKVLYLIAIPATMAGGLGCYAGSGYAMRGGSKNIRKLMFLVLALLFLKVGLDLAGVSI